MHMHKLRQKGIWKHTQEADEQEEETQVEVEVEEERARQQRRRQNCADLHVNYWFFN